jgi:predicted nucleic acid-binding protein
MLIDTGPLVAILHAGDQDHDRCKAVLRRLREPPATVWPVIGEALYLLAASWAARDALWEMVSDGHVRLLPLGMDDVPRMRDLMCQYRDSPMDIADAALVRVAERERVRHVFTLDRRHFHRYRPHRLGHFVIIP